MSPSRWSPVTNAGGYCSPVPPDEYPSRETALSIISALDRLEDGTWSEVQRLTGIANPSGVADTCYGVYGYPELEPATMAGRMSDVFMRPKHHRECQAPPALLPAPLSVDPDHGYGFTPRR